MLLWDTQTFAAANVSRLHRNEHTEKRQIERETDLAKTVCTSSRNDFESAKHFNKLSKEEGGDLSGKPNWPARESFRAAAPHKQTGADRPTSVFIWRVLDEARRLRNWCRCNNRYYLTH